MQYQTYTVFSQCLFVSNLKRWDKKDTVKYVIAQITKVPKIDYKPGIKKLPMFHCERCKSQWEKYDNVSLQCANPNDIVVPISKEAAFFFEVGMNYC